MDIQELQNTYIDIYGKQPPSGYKNNVEWLEKKIVDKLEKKENNIDNEDNKKFELLYGFKVPNGIENNKLRKAIKAMEMYIFLYGSFKKRFDFLVGPEKRIDYVINTVKDIVEDNKDQLGILQDELITLQRELREWRRTEGRPNKAKDTHTGLEREIDIKKKQIEIEMYNLGKKVL